jgi:gamma-glutamyltranspeptidase/glutathione hydrolase
VLAAGGNAVDACIAAAAVAWVAESPLTGPGAGGFMLVHRARDGVDFLLDFFVAAPGRGLPSCARAELEEVDVLFGSGDMTQSFLIGPASCAVPGMVAGLAEAHRRFATIAWPDLLAGGARIARDGVMLGRDQALLHEILDPVLRYDREGDRLYGPGRPRREGDLLAIPDLAGTLDRLATEGAADFYTGELGSRISAEVIERGGQLTPDDLAAYRVVSRRALRVGYRDHTVVTNPPPSSGGVLIAFALALLDRLGPGGTPGSVGALARLAEVAREAAQARGAGFNRSLQRGGLAPRLLAEAHIRQVAREILARGRREPAREPAVLPSTTHISVVDARGNAASLSSSTGCGSGLVVPGTGIHLNNMLGERDLNPSSRPITPGCRLTSMMAPSVVLADGRPRLVLGSAGSERLRGAIVQVIVNTLDHRLPLVEAIDKPRVHLDGDELHCEAGFDPEAAAELDALGYRTVRWPGSLRNLFFGGVSAVAVRRDGSLEACGDPRRGGHGVVVS